MVYKPVRLRGMLIGILLGGLFFGIYIWGVHFSLGAEGRILKWLLLIPAYLLLAGYLFLLYGLATIRYIVGDEALVIRWAHKTYTIPWQDITEIIQATGRVNLVNILGISWPGYIAGMYDVKCVALCKIFGTNTKELLVVKTGGGSFGLTPVPELYGALAAKAPDKERVVDLYEMSDKEIGPIIGEDLVYLILMALNVITLVALVIYLAIFFPGSGAPTNAILLMVLAMALFAFNIANASRLFHYFTYAAYMIWLIGVTINVAFVIMAMSQVGFR